MSRVRWSTDIRRVVKELIEKHPRTRFPTIRSVYYYLGSLNLIPLTRQGYKRLDELLTKMRKAGEIPWGYFSVRRGLSGSLGSRYIDPERYLESIFDELEGSYRDYTIPLWYGQPVHLEVWVEKAGLLPTFEDWLMDYDVKVRTGEGYVPWEFVYSSIEDIKRYLEDREGERVVILHFGDLDPSGMDISRFVKESMEFFGVNLEFRRIALFPEQVEEYGLPLWPERMDVIQKIKRDPRRKRFFEKYGEIACELDAFVSLAPDGLKNLVRREVEKYIDKQKLEERREVNVKYRWMIHEAIEKNRALISTLKEKILDDFRRSAPSSNTS